MNATVLPQYDLAMDALRPVLRNLPGKIVGIDGRAGVGKTTLGRYLAWRFNVSLVETDLFMIKGQGQVLYRQEEGQHVIASRIDGDDMDTRRPVIVDGIALRRLLGRLGRKPDFVIYVTHRDPPESTLLKEDLASYEADFSPEGRADL